jgi:hypothetical protein
MAGKMATKNDLKNFATKDDLAAFKDEVAALISSGFAKLRAEDIEPMKRDIAGLKQNAEKVWNVFAPRLEYDDRSASSSKSSAFPVQSRPELTNDPFL